MRSCKKNMIKRAFSKGYNVGFSGRPKDGCPHNVTSQRQAWLNGWKEGWVDRLEGGRLSGLELPIQPGHKSSDQ